MASRKALKVPVNSIMRNPFRVGSVACSVATRGDAFENTLTKLTDPATGRELYLVGTTHGSSTLAVRTQKLIQDLKPDNVLVSVDGHAVVCDLGCAVFMPDGTGDVAVSGSTNSSDYPTTPGGFSPPSARSSRPVGSSARRVRR